MTLDMFVLPNSWKCSFQLLEKTLVAIRLLSHHYVSQSHHLNYKNRASVGEAEIKKLRLKFAASAAVKRKMVTCVKVKLPAGLLRSINRYTAARLQRGNRNGLLHQRHLDAWHASFLGSMK